MANKLSQEQTETKVDNKAYFQIWLAEKEHTRTRWTNVTFFMSISFAILGFSFQQFLIPPEPTIIRIAGLFIYWFAFVLFWRMYKYNHFLRDYLVEMEKTGRTTLDLQSKTLEGPDANKHLSTVRLLFYFGLLYTLGVILLWIIPI